MQWSDKNMRDLITNPMIVPEYQRKYSWGEDQIDMFFYDLERFIERDEDYYLFGQIIIHNSGKYNIVDGQQRILTSTIFLCVLRDILKERRYGESESLLNKLHNAIGFEDDGFNLTAGHENKEFFFNYIQCAKHDYPVNSESDNVVQFAYQRLKSLVETYIDRCPVESFNKLKVLATKFLSGFHVSYVETESMTQAFIIFETLNARGLPLEAPDLLKNHIFSKLDENHEYIRDKWIGMVNKLQDIANGCTQYIKYFWNSRHEFVREKDLFTNVSDLECTEMYDFLSDMFDSVDYYIQMVKPETIVSDFNKNCKNSLSNLKKFGATSFIPLILALKNKGVAQNQIEKVMSAVECMILRNQVIGKKTANRNEKMFSDWALDFTEGNIDVEEIVEKIYKLSNSDEVVQSAFVKFSPNNRIAKTLLISLFNSENTEIEIKNDVSEVHLEHIMPQTIGKWDLEEDVWKEYHVRFGNMVLLDGKKNISISNGTFDIKKGKYRESRIEETRKIAEYADWTPDDIDNRQKNLYNKVIKRWPISLSGELSTDNN